MALFIQLKAIPDLPGIGIYGASKDRLPERARFLAPGAADSFLQLHENCGIACSDMYRSAEASLLARKNRAGAQRPSYSGHNYGFSIDLDVDGVLKRNKWPKRLLDETMEAAGWYCHRRDHDRGFEDWHYNYLPGGEFGTYHRQGESKTSSALERKIFAVYGDAWKMLTTDQAQGLLKSLGFYGGLLDGLIGPISKTAIAAFQRAWLLPETKRLDTATCRTLAFVAATKDLVP